MPLLTSPVYTNASGDFTLQSGYRCPSASSQLYLVATGGSASADSNAENVHLALLGLLGTCANPLAFVSLNEVSTVAAVSALAPFMSSYSQTASGATTLQALNTAITMANALVDFTTGEASGPALLPDQAITSEKLFSLADMLALCVDDAGPAPRSGGVCGSFLSSAASPEGNLPSDTVSAMLNIARHPGHQVNALFAMSQLSSSYKPALSSPPTDWSLAIAPTIAPPVFTPASGTYTGNVSVTLAAARQANIYYTIDGTTPSPRSALYTGVLTLSKSATIRAIAVLNGLSSSVAAGKYTIAPPPRISLTPANGTTLSASQTQVFVATVSNAVDKGVTWSLSPIVGFMTPAGTYTAPATIDAAQRITVTATSNADPSRSASALVLLEPIAKTAKTYYLSATGKDSNSGTSPSSPWLSPSHALTCGDVIIAAPSNNYAASSFAGGKWGKVTCAGRNNVAWLKCASFDACKIRITSGTLDGMRVSASFWGVQGWEVNDTAGGAGGGTCFNAVPATQDAVIHHIVFANNIANGCPLNGFAMTPNGNTGVDYWAAIGNIAYHAGYSNTYCGSGISSYEPSAFDSAPGTHIYVADNLSFGNTNPPGCYDGNGIILDTFDGDQTGMPETYTQQAVISNNLAISNGAVGVRIEYNNAGQGASHATIIAHQNTMWGNSSATGQYGNPNCGEMQLYRTVNTSAYLNLAVTTQTGCYGDPQNPAYAYDVNTGDRSDLLDENFGWSRFGTFSQAIDAPGFQFGDGNIFGTDPMFVNAAIPGAPSCGTASDVKDCMHAVIAGFTARAPGAAGFGYQAPIAKQAYDALFPQWLCHVNLPANLTSMGCPT